MGQIESTSKFEKTKWYKNAVSVDIFAPFHFHTFNIRKNIYAYIIILELSVK